MSEPYRVVGVTVPGALVTIRGRRYALQPWTARKARKEAVCAVTGAAIKPGDRVYGPIDNGVNRGDRILASWVDAQTKGLTK